MLGRVPMLGRPFAVDLPPPPPAVDMLNLEGLDVAAIDAGLVEIIEEREGTPEREFSDALDTVASVLRLRDAMAQRLYTTGTAMLVRCVAGCGRSALDLKETNSSRCFMCKVSRLPCRTTPAENLEGGNNLSEFPTTSLLGTQPPLRCSATTREHWVPTSRVL